MGQMTCAFVIDAMLRHSNRKNIAVSVKDSESFSMLQNAGPIICLRRGCNDVGRILQADRFELKLPFRWHGESPAHRLSGSPLSFGSKDTFPQTAVCISGDRRIAGS